MNHPTACDAAASAEVPPTPARRPGARPTTPPAFAPAPLRAQASSAARRRANRALGCLLAAALGLGPSAFLPGRAAAQDEDGYRIGVSFGGTSTLALVVERLEGRRAIELSLGTWSFRNVSVAATTKAYLGPSAFRPVVGGGLWAVVGLHPVEGERRGAALIARFPIGFDWRLAPEHFLGLELGLNRALWIRRADFSDLPPSPRLIPIPALSYRTGP